MNIAGLVLSLVSAAIVNDCQAGRGLTLIRASIISTASGPASGYP